MKTKLMCYNGYSRYVDQWHDEKQLKKFRKNRNQSSKSVLYFLPLRKQLNQLGFTDEMLKAAIIKYLGKYNKSKEKKEILETKGGFDKVFMHWFTSEIKLDASMTPPKKSEQISGKFSETQERISYRGCSEVHKWELVGNLIEYRVPRTAHFDSFLMHLLETRYQGFSKYVRKSYKGQGFGSIYGANKDNLRDFTMDFRTTTEEINTNFFDLVNDSIDVKALREKAVKDFIEWNIEKMAMSDQDLKEWIKERGLISVYSLKKGQRDKKIKEYLPTVKQERQEIEDRLKQIRKTYDNNRFKSMLALIKITQLKEAKEE